MTTPVAKPEIVPSNLRFAGPESIYQASDAPPVTAYDTTAGDAFGAQSKLVAADKMSEQRFDGPASIYNCLLYTSPSPRDATLSRMPSSA